MSQAVDAWLSMPLPLTVLLGAFFVAGPLVIMGGMTASAPDDAPPPRGPAALRYAVSGAFYALVEAAILCGCGLIIEPAWDWAAATGLFAASAAMTWMWLRKLYLDRPLHTPAVP